MSISDKMHSQGKKPNGWFGKLIGRLMNISHSSIYKWGINSSLPNKNASILDIGCGGGKTIKLFSKIASQGKIYGIDHSPEMVELATKKNNKASQKNTVVIVLGSANSLPFDEAQFALITAFETIQFWPEMERSLNEVLRCLAPGGKFLIVNRYPKPDSKWTQFLQFKNAQAYKKALESAGFKNITLDETSRKGWILIQASK